MCIFSATRSTAEASEAAACESKGSQEERAGTKAAARVQTFLSNVAEPTLKSLEDCNFI